MPAIGFGALYYSKIKVLLENEIGVSEQRFIEYEPETQYFHYSIDVIKESIYEME